jgi:alpha-L-rhamnosidase
MGGPIFGASGKINVAYFDALRAMASMCISAKLKDSYVSRAERLRTSLVTHLWDPSSGILRMSDITSPTGICQDIYAYGISTGIAPFHSAAESILAAPKDGTLPLTFRGIERWEDKKVVSPYASGFSAEALFERHHGSSAVELVERVWGRMADPNDPNFSGGHWEAMKPDGTPITDDTSLMHGWSTWPVYLLPRYLGGLEPIEPGWTSWKCRPVLAGMDFVEVHLSTPVGDVEISLHIDEARGTGQIIAVVPSGSVAEICAPKGWIMVTSEDIGDAPGRESRYITGQGERSVLRIAKVHKGAEQTSVLSGKTQAVVTAKEKGSSPERQRAWYRQRMFLDRITKWIF